MPSSTQVGKLGEKIATDFLTTKGFMIKERNFRTKSGEIDIIAQKDRTIFFIEVKTRVGIKKGKPYESVTPRKLSHLKHTSELYVLQNNLKTYKLSLNVISIILSKDQKVQKLDYFDDVML